MRKRTIALLVLLIALGGVVVSQAYLFTVRQVQAENIITYGSLQMKLIETDENNNPVPMNNGPVLRLTVLPEETVTRRIVAQNICQEAMYLRARLSVSGVSVSGEKFSLPAREAVWAVNEVDGWIPFGDWYYYEKVLGPNEFTASLLKEDKILFYTEEILKTHPNEPLSLSVEVQAVQSKNNGPDALHAQGWPEEANKP